MRVLLTCSTKLVGGQISVALGEPSTCNYVLTLESPLFCDIGESMDEDGVLTLQQKAKEPKQDETEEKKKPKQQGISFLTS